MSEKQKAIYLEEWLIEAIRREADKHHRSWMREVQAILEEVIFDRQNIEKAESEKQIDRRIVGGGILECKTTGAHN